MPRINKLTLLPKVPLVITESADEFDALRDAFEREIKPRGIIEQMYVHDISAIVWEILRLRRCKVVIINAAFSHALENLLVQLRPPGQQDFHARGEARKLVHVWFTDKEAQKWVSETLGRRANGKLPPIDATRAKAPVPVPARVENGPATTR